MIRDAGPERKMNCRVIFGYPSHGEGGMNRYALLSVDAGALTIRVEQDEPVVLPPDEVVEIRVEGGRFTSAALIVEHVAFNKIGNVVLTPGDRTCAQLLAEIARAGFQPSAKPGVPWEPGQPFPHEEIEDGEAQQGGETPAPPITARSTADVRPNMLAVTTIRMVSSTCFLLAGTALAMAGGLLGLHGLLGSEPLPSTCGREIAIGIGTSVAGCFFIWHGMNDHETRRR